MSRKRSSPFEGVRRRLRSMVPICVGVVLCLGAAPCVVAQTATMTPTGPVATPTVLPHVILTIPPGITGQPGGTITVPMYAENTVALRGLQFDLIDVPDRLATVVSRRTTRTQSLLVSCSERSGADAGKAGCALLSPGSALLASGSGAIVEVDYDVDPAVPSGTHVTLCFGNVSAADRNLNPVPVFAQCEVVAIGSTAATPTPTVRPGGCNLCGDVNGDGQLDVVDALLVGKTTVGLPATLPCPLEGDVDHSGTIDGVDALFIAQRTGGVRTSLACQPAAPAL